jgi:hypothetical protein
MAIGAPKDRWYLALAGGTWLLFACGHTDPFAIPPFGTTQPFDPTPPVRLTFNESADRGASWLPDGSGILYSAQQLGRADADVCLAELPPGGGSQRRLVCDLAREDANLTNALESPAAGVDGRLAFLAVSNSIGGTNFTTEALTVAPALDGAGAAMVQRLPYTLPGEPEHSWVTQISWQGENRLLYLAGLTAIRRPCPLCVLDTITTGLKAALLDLSAPGAVPVVLPGTDFASGVSPGATGDEVFYTLNGDTRVYRRVLSTGDQSVVHDFGAAGIARDVQTAGGRLTATVGGRVHFESDAILGPVQWDSGGFVHVVDLGTGADVALPDEQRLFRRPVLAPGGDRLVAEGYPLIIVGSGASADTTVGRAGDLYLFSTP